MTFGRSSVTVDSDGLCVLRAPYNPSLLDAIHAIPGRRWEKESRAWRVVLGPDRAETVARLVESFSALSFAGDGSRERLNALRERRDLRHPVVERVSMARRWHLSFCTDWEHEIVRDVQARFDALRHEDVGRLSVPVDPMTAAELVELLADHGIRLSPRAHQALDHPAGVRVAGLDRVPARAAFRRPIDPPPWRAEMSTAVLDGKPWFAIATLWGRVPAPLVAAEGLKRDGNLCLVPMQGAQRELIRRLLVEQPQLRVATKTLRCLELLDGVDVNETPPPALLTVDEESETFAVDVVWDDRLSERAAELPEARGGAASVSVVADAATAPTVAAFAREQGLAVDAAAAQLLTELEGEHGAGEELVKLSAATDADLDALRIRGELMPFQRAGVAYALRQRRTFIADEQGLGKTIQALAAIEAASAYPAVIVCPASLKLNWLRETNRWLPHRRATLLKGRRATELEAADVTIVNYDIVDAHIDALAAQEPGALVFDESHYCKNAKAKRTKALMALAERLPADALRLALTGTPLVNRPRELVPQLRILGRLDEFASGTSLERRFRGPEARARLHWHLRRRCYVRRRKADVLPQLPAKRRITVPMPLVNDREYRRLERNLLDWLHTQIRDPALLQRRVDSALRAQALVKLNALRHVAARGKLAAAIEWIDAYVASGERLVVFAHHRDIHRAVLDAFPTAARILGEDDVAERDAEVQRFQAGGPPLCVCSLEAASHGFTLTAAATVAFLELGWTPAKHDQAEDRLHRIGQQQRVTAYYLLAADTIDERIAALIDHKRAVVGSITDGSIASEEAIVDRLLRELATSPSPAVAAAA